MTDLSLQTEEGVSSCVRKLMTAERPQVSPVTPASGPESWHRPGSAADRVGTG